MVMKMEEFKQIIILSYKAIVNKDELFLINKPITLIDDTHLMINDITYVFDYLVFTNANLINNLEQTSILMEGNVPVTNYFFQTTYENIYYTSDEKINLALQNIIENE